MVPRFSEELRNADVDPFDQNLRASASESG
jgi:hypothetical protein